ncbi:MAG: hypothetical protein FWD13_05145 [Treponema sp.]|nr:hypothetical protein [Treponema sp.]
MNKKRILVFGIVFALLAIVGSVDAFAQVTASVPISFNDFMRASRDPNLAYRYEADATILINNLNALLRRAGWTGNVTIMSAARPEGTAGSTAHHLHPMGRAIDLVDRAHGTGPSLFDALAPYIQGSNLRMQQNRGRNYVHFDIYDTRGGRIFQ